MNQHLEFEGDFFQRMECHKSINSSWNERGDLYGLSLAGEALGGVKSCTIVLGLDSRREACDKRGGLLLCAPGLSLIIRRIDLGSIRLILLESMRITIPRIISNHPIKRKILRNDDIGNFSPSASIPTSTPVTIEETAAQVDTTTALPPFKPFV